MSSRVEPSEGTFRGGKQRFLIGDPLNQQSYFKDGITIPSGEVESHDGVL